MILGLRGSASLFVPIRRWSRLATGRAPSSSQVSHGSWSDTGNPTELTDFGTGIIEEDIPLGIPFLSNETSIHDDFGTTGIRIALCPNQAMVPLSDGTSAIIFQVSHGSW